MGIKKSLLTCCQVPCKELPKLLLLVDPVHEEFLVCVFEGKIEGLGGKVADDIDDVSSPEAEKPLLFVHSAEAVDDAFVPLLLGDELLSVLDL